MNSQAQKPVIWKKYKPALLKTPRIKSGVATGINERGDIVGYATVKGSLSDTPFLIRKGKFYDLKTLITNTNIANSYDGLHPLKISDTGVILAVGAVDGKTHTYLLKPR